MLLIIIIVKDYIVRDANVHKNISLAI